MALCTVWFKGKSIGKDAAMNVAVPDAPGRFPVLYLLHGLSDDYTAWLRRTSIERYAAALPLIVVMPDGHRSFYANDPREDGLAFEDHMTQDVVGFVDRVFPTIPRAGARAVAGLSMGGYGAMMLALRHPDIYSAACSHSGAMLFTHARRAKRRGHPGVRHYAGVLGPRKYDLFDLARKLKRSRRRLALRMDCGTEDGLLDANRQFHAHLDKLGIRHEYAEHPGPHNWGYWDQHIQETLAFVMRRLK